MAQTKEYNKAKIAISKFLPVTNSFDCIENVLEFKKNNIDAKVIGLYGIGARATVLKLKTKSGETLAIRVLKDYSEQIDKDLAINKYLSHYEMAPVVHKVGLIRNLKSDKDNVYIILMDPVTDLNSFLKSKPSIPSLLEAFDCLLGKKYLLKFLHGDMHTENIVILKDGVTLGFIDFDFSLFKVTNEYNVLDFVPLIASIKGMEYGSQKTELLKGICDYYKKTFSLEIDIANIHNLKHGGYEYTVGRRNFNSYIRIIPAEFKPKDVLHDLKIKLPKIVP